MREAGRAHFARLRAERAETEARVRVLMDSGSAFLIPPNEVVMVTPAIGKPGWRITWFDGTMPTRHHDYATMDELIKDEMYDLDKFGVRAMWDAEVVAWFLGDESPCRTASCG